MSEENTTDTEKKLKKENLPGFYHNEQSVRVVDILEDRDADFYRGLNLTKEVRA